MFKNIQEQLLRGSEQHKIIEPGTASASCRLIPLQERPKVARALAYPVNVELRLGFQQAKDLPTPRGKLPGEGLDRFCNGEESVLF
mmetsp:Transcript_12171/g.37103  ORF Transcript_12171/g.37103 Transcript_12171/m.37103 type:complete len:86 (-) Transcript_12171:1651-1908(-)